MMMNQTLAQLRDLKREHDAWVQASLAGMAKRLGMVNRKLAGIQGLLRGGG